MTDQVFSHLKSKIPVAACRKRRQDGDFVIVSSAEGGIHFLNSTAGEVLELCNGSRNVQEIGEEIKCRYPDIAATEIESDLVHILREMQWAQVVYLNDAT